LDIDIQLACRDAMEGRVGAVVVMDIFTGDVLAAYSSPSFSVAELSTERWRALRSAPENPLLNRAFAGLYPPGSTIKPLILMAGIHHRLVSPGEIVYRCTGGYRIGRRIVHCYHGCSHGWLTPSQFLERSCNGCSCYVGALVGPELLCEQAAAIGFGRRTGIELDTVEGAGSFPTAADFSSGRLGPGEFANICLGQSITVTPLQSARYAAALANGGRVLKPRLVVDRDETAPVQVADMRWRDDAWQTVMAGMVDVVNSRRGTGRAANLGTGWPRLAGKTGTADITTAPGGGNITWMIAVGPADGVPRYAVSTVVEQGRSGGATVAPRIKGLMTAVFTSDGTRREYEMMAKTE
jgi:penicillin-binding protein 2